MKLCEYADKLKNKRVAVVGLGVSNQPLVRYLCAHGISVIGRDKTSREALGAVADELENLGAVLKFGDGYLNDLTEDVIFRSPGIRPDLPAFLSAMERGAVLTSEMEAFFEVCPCKIFAVTGSDGKTTTTTIVSELLKAEGYTVHVGGNIGTPLLTMADEMSPEDLVVLELSSFQLMTMRVSPAVAVITNLAPNHLDVHTSMDEYVEAKKNIFLGQSGDGVCVFNADNEITAAMPALAAGSVRMFSRKNPQPGGFYARDGVIYAHSEDAPVSVMREDEIFLPGKHNVENFLAAFAAVSGYVSLDNMRKVAREFRGVEHRIEFVRELEGVKYYNDSIASSPSRTMAGLHAFRQKVILIAGGKDKGVPFDELGCEICDHAKAVVLTGFTAEKMRNAIISAPNYTKELPVRITEGFDEAVYTARKLAEPGDVVILSPACTSFDRFKNFAQRGKVYKEIVNGMVETE